MIEFSILIPSKSNAGVVFLADHDMVFEELLLNRFGGFSGGSATITGSWKGADGAIYMDVSRVYVVALPSVLDAGKLREVIDFAKVYYEQEAIYLRYLGLAEIL